MINKDRNYSFEETNWNAYLCGDYITLQEYIDFLRYQILSGSYYEDSSRIYF